MQSKNAPILMAPPSVQDCRSLRIRARLQMITILTTLTICTVLAAHYVNLVVPGSWVDAQNGTVARPVFALSFFIIVAVLSVLFLTDGMWTKFSPVSDDEYGVLNTLIKRRPESMAYRDAVVSMGRLFTTYDYMVIATFDSDMLWWETCERMRISDENERKKFYGNTVDANV